MKSTFKKKRVKKITAQEFDRKFERGEDISPYLDFENATVTIHKAGLDKQYALWYASFMTTLTATKARARLFKLLDESASRHEPIQITGKRNNAILIGEEDWRAIQETLYLLSIPGMRESIRKGLKTPVSKCSNALKW